ncbi:ATP-binding protein [Leptospira sp. 96542]|nr:ATP-binding protein [Leptospira sp. 96542]
MNHNYGFVLVVPAPMNEFFEKIKGFFKDEEASFEAKQLLEENWHKIAPDYFKKLLTTLENAVYVLDKQGNYFYVNQTAANHTGKALADFAGKNIFSLFPELKGTEIGRKFQIAIEEGQSFHIQQQFPPMNHWYDLRIMPTDDYILVIGKEITSQKTTEIGYESVLKKNRAILGSIPDRLYGIRSDGTIIDYKLYPDFPGWDFLELTNKVVFSHIATLFPTSLVPKLEKIIFDVLETGESSTLEYSVEGYHSEKHYEARFAKTGDSEVLAIIRDISDRKKAEALKNEFISLVSHELRTPLTSIKGSIDLLLAGVSGELTNQTKSLLNICRKNTQRLVRFVTDLLDIEALDSGNINFKYKTYLLSDLLQSSVDGMRTFAEQYHVLLNYKPDGTESYVYVDEDRLNHCITNLISNAVKYTPKFSEVLILTELNEDFIQIQIKDNGPGIDPNFQPRLFHRFAQGAPPKDKLVGGSGLGLSITKGFVEAMNGKIHFLTSETGTTFIIEFPLEKKKRMAAEQ